MTACTEIGGGRDRRPETSFLDFWSTSSALYAPDEGLKDAEVSPKNSFQALVVWRGGGERTHEVRSNFRRVLRQHRMKGTTVVHMVSGTS